MREKHSEYREKNYKIKSTNIKISKWRQAQTSASDWLNECTNSWINDDDDIFPKINIFRTKKDQMTSNAAWIYRLQKKRKDETRRKGRAHKNPITSIMNQRISMDRCGKWYAKSVFCFYIWCTWKDSAKIEQTQRFIWNDIFDLYYLLTSKRKLIKFN